MKIIKVQEKTHAKLLNIGSKGETFDAIIDRLIDDYTKK